jgi:NAD(P)-dependent dehydrogenase (short-subunit alcohol dehydrogenase family)
MKKSCLITGASSGIGKEVAKQLAQAGHHVIMVCRDSNKGQSALEEIKTQSSLGRVDLLIADLSSQSAIRALADTVRDRYAKLDVLINNAGVVLTHRETSVDGYEKTLATNHLGPFLLTNLLLDLMRSSSPSRIVNVSSAIHKWGSIDFNDLEFKTRKYQFMKVYAQSKLLMNLFTFELAHRLAGTGITVNGLHPGAVNTHLGTANADSFIMRLLDKTIKFFMISPQQAAKTPVYLALSPDVADITGKYFLKCKPVSTSPISLDALLAKKAWIVSSKLVGISEE